MRGAWYERKFCLFGVLFLGGGSERISNCLACSFPSFSPSEAGHVLPGPKPIPLLSSQAPDDPQWINYLCFCC